MNCLSQAEGGLASGAAQCLQFPICSLPQPSEAQWLLSLWKGTSPPHPSGLCGKRGQEPYTPLLGQLGKDTCWASGQPWSWAHGNAQGPSQARVGPAPYMALRVLGGASLTRA